MVFTAYLQYALENSLLKNLYGFQQIINRLPVDWWAFNADMFSISNVFRSVTITTH
jgi:hypothetical protein